MTDQPLLQLESTELRAIYNSIEIDVLKDVLLVVGYMNMSLEALQSSHQKVNNSTKKEIIRQVKEWKRETQG